MCLPIKRNQKPEIAKKPIICYKCLARDMLSPCFEQKYELGKMLTSEISIKKEIFVHQVEKGFHTYMNKGDALYASVTYYWHNRVNKDKEDQKAPIVVKCEIPIGATYYESVSLNPGIGYEYASNQLIPLEIISQ